jgi:catechol 2,3-dioxygenase-like lactoylglutathione lyase family enzyme
LKPKLMYFGIRVKNMDESIKFYTEVMGMKLKERIPHFEMTGGEVAVVVSEDKGPEIELNYYREDSKYFEPYANGQELDHLAFFLGKDYDEFLAEAKKKGYDSVLEVKSQKEHYSYIKDPNGIFIEIVGPFY